MIKAFENLELWWITGAQLLYGGETVKTVDGHSQEMVDGLNESGIIPIKVVYKGTANSDKEVAAIMMAANNDEKCVGVITWMHTFSPAKMWIHGLEIPWDTMDMDFMNLNQSAHGDREFGHICSRLRKPRKVVVGYWKEKKTQEHIAVWARVAAAVADARDMLIIRFGDQMNNVAVTDGDKVSAEQVLGYHVDYCCVSELMEYWKKVNPADVDALVEEYHKLYKIVPCEAGEEIGKKKIWNAARAELAIRAILKAKGAKGFTTNFDDLGSWDDPDSEGFVGFDQIPGLASQRLMAEGYGFGAEGDWKVAAMVRLMKIMTGGVKDAKGTSMLEDYTYNLVKGKEGILEAHMLEICPTIADGPISIKCQPLSMGDREDPARLVFTSKEGHGIATSLIDLGNRFRLIINDVNCKKVEKPMPKLPVATNFWTPEPDMYTGAEAWILAGGAHHTAFTYDLTAEQMGDWAAMMGIEAVYIDKDTKIRDLKRDLMLGEVFYR